MHILLIHQYFLQDKEGGGARWNETSRIWKAKGHDVTVVTGNQHYLKQKSSGRFSVKFRQTTNADGVKVISCPVYRTSGKAFLLKRMWEYFSFSVAVIGCALFVCRQRPDVIIATSPPLTVSIAAMLWSWRRKCPYIAEVRDLWPESAIDMKVLSNPLMIRLAFWLEQVFYKYAALIVVLTPAFKEILVNKKQVAADKIIYIPNAVDFLLADQMVEEGRHHKLRQQLSLENKLVIIYVGAHGRANGLEVLLKVAEKLRKHPVCFLLIGDGEQKDTLKKQVAGLQLPNIRFMDLMPKEEVLKYILMADLGLTVLQKNETFKTIYSNKTFDYFSCRKPVLMAVEGISKELIETADAGTYVDTEDPDTWIDPILQYFRLPAKRVTQGENGYRFAKLYFDRQQWAEVYLKNIEKRILKWKTSE